MSRCFPFPSSDLSRKDASQLGSIKKLHNESGNVKLRKEKNRENKEDNRENNREKKESKKRSRQQDKLDYTVHKKKKSRHDQGSEFFESFRDWNKDASDQCEKSGVTEEQGPPSSVPNPCNSLESTQNSSKKNKLLGADMKKKDQGLVLRIKLPLMKRKEPATANTSTEPSSSREAVAVTRIIRPSSAGKVSPLKGKTSVKQQELHPTPANEGPCFSGRNTGVLMIEGVAASDFISSCGWEMGKCFSDLILNWNPSSSQSYDLNSGSEDWLFAPPRQSSLGNHGAKSCKASKPDHKVGLISTNSLQPQACYLPELDFYQLPYVVPF